jgi:CheY-like chemotaxis protein
MLNARPARARGYAAPVSGRRVLVVDDDPGIRRFVSSLLVEAGYDAQTAVDGDHALRSVIALRPDLIILDIHVPEKEIALRFAQTYRERVVGERRAPIIALSGAADLEEAGQQLGASGFLRKPFDVDELLRLVAKHVPRPVAHGEPAAASDPAEDDTAATPAPLVEPGTSPG